MFFNILCNYTIIYKINHLLNVFIYSVKSVKIKIVNQKLIHYFKYSLFFLGVLCFPGVLP